MVAKCVNNGCQPQSFWLYLSSGVMKHKRKKFCGTLSNEVMVLLETLVYHLDRDVNNNYHYHFYSKLTLQHTQ